MVSHTKNLSFIGNSAPFFYKGGDTGCLLIHGFTSTPNEMAQLGEYLYERGHTVLAVRLTHHSTDIRDMARSEWKDWFFSALDGWYMLKNICKHIVPIGLSLGGVTALKLAAYYPVSGVVSMSAPFQLQPKRLAGLSKYLWRIVPYIKKRERYWDDLEAYRLHVDYTYLSVRAVGQVHRYLKRFEDELKVIKVPVLLLHSLADKGIAPDNAKFIFDRLSATNNKELFFLKKSGHILTEDSEKKIVFGKVSTWLHDTLIVD